MHNSAIDSSFSFTDYHEEEHGSAVDAEKKLLTMRDVLMGR